ncbi:MAG: ATP-binding protein [Cyclobacteriaceae bacterium]
MLLKRFFPESTDAVFFTDTFGRLVEMNQLAESHALFSEKSPKGKSISQLLPFIVASHLNKLFSAYTPGIHTVPVNLETPDAITNADITIVATHHNGLNGYLIFVPMRYLDILIDEPKQKLNENIHPFEIVEDKKPNILEQSLQETAQIKERFELAVQAAGTGVWEVDLLQDSFIPDQSLINLLGLNVPANEAMPLEQWVQWIHQEDRDAVLDFFMLQFKDNVGKLEYTFRMVNSSGEIIWVLTRGKVIYRKNVAIKLICASTDINKSVEANQKLKKAITELEHIFASFPDLFFKFNRDGDYLEVGGNATADLLIPSFELMGKNMKDVLPKGVYETFYYTMCRAWSTGMVETCEYKLHLHGDDQFFETRIIALSDEECLAIVRNISDVVKTHHELLKARHVAEEALNAKEEFLATMSHEIRTPLNAVIGMTNLMMSTDDASRQEYMKTLKFSSEHLLSLVNDILDYTKIRAGKLEIEQIEFDLMAMLENMARGTNYLLQSKNISFNFACDKEVPRFVIGDTNRLAQILNNLLNNAGKFTRKGQVDLKVVYKGQDNEGNVLIDFIVKDTGIGMEAESLSKIFQPYQQSEKDTSRKYGGTGLGLTIVKQLVVLQGGTIDVSSTPGVGSEFVVQMAFGIPKSTRSLHEQGNFDEKYLSGKQELGLKVLYADDVASNLLLMKGYLKMWGCEMQGAFNGEEACELAAKESYDLIMLDLLMPHKNGYQAAEEIRQKSGPNQFKPMLAVTAEITNKIKELALSSGINGMVIKPISQDDLLRKILHSIQGIADDHEKNDATVDEETTINEPKPSINFETSNRLYTDERDNYLKLLNMLKSEYEGHYNHLRQAISNNDLERFKSIRHKMMSNMKLFEMHEMLGLLEDIRNNYKENSQFSNVNMYFVRLKETFDNLLRAIHHKTTELLMEEELY